MSKERNKKMIIDAPKERKKKAVNYDKLVSIRMDSFQIEKLKIVASVKSTTYQKLIRKVLDDFIEDNRVY